MQHSVNLGKRVYVIACVHAEVYVNLHYIYFYIILINNKGFDKNGIGKEQIFFFKFQFIYFFNIL